jgi:hypothetical protein
LTEWACGSPHPHEHVERHRFQAWPVSEKSPPPFYLKCGRLLRTGKRREGFLGNHAANPPPSPGKADSAGMSALV